MNEDFQNTTIVNPANPSVETQPKDSYRLVPKWRFLLPLILQTGLIFSIPLQPLYTQITGKTVVLKTVPVDPYDVLRGYSQTLSYDISNPESLTKLSGWQEIIKKQKIIRSSQLSDSKSLLLNGTKIYVILEAPKTKNSQSQTPQVWKAIAVSDSMPKSLAENRIALRGTYKTNWGAGTIEYGLETYYLPEENIDQINQDISEARFGKKLQPVVVEAKIDSSGKAVPMSFWIGKTNYQY